MLKKRDLLMVALQAVDADIDGICVTINRLQKGLFEPIPALTDLYNELRTAQAQMHFKVPALQPAVKVTLSRFGTVPKLREMRTAANLSQASVAEACGLSQAHYSKIERCLITPTTPVVQRLAAAFHVSMQDLLGVRSTPSLWPNENVQTTNPKQV